MSLYPHTLTMPVTDGVIIQVKGDYLGETWKVRVDEQGVVYIANNMAAEQVVGLGGKVNGNDYQLWDASKAPEPCPFCGSINIAAASADQNVDHRGWESALYCRDCECVGPKHKSWNTREKKI